MERQSGSLGRHFLELATRDFKGLKKLAEKAFDQIDSTDFHWQPDQESNSIAIIIQHISGNMLSRWTDFLTTDGEKETRQRDREFEVVAESRDELMARWEAGWACLFQTLSTLTEDDLLTTVLIRSEPHTVLQAINRQTAHYALHVGQIVYVAKHLKSEIWTSLSIPRGKSEEFIPKQK